MVREVKPPSDPRRTFCWTASRLGQSLLVLICLIILRKQVIIVNLIWRLTYTFAVKESLKPLILSWFSLFNYFLHLWVFLWVRAQIRDSHQVRVRISNQVSNFTTISTMWHFISSKIEKSLFLTSKQGGVLLKQFWTVLGFFLVGGANETPQQGSVTSLLLVSLNLQQINCFI